MAETAVKPRQGLKKLADSTPAANIEDQQAIFQFWNIITKGTGANEFIIDVTINYLVFYDLLYNNGFRRFDIDEESVFIQIKSNRIVKRIKTVVMQDFIIDYIDKLPAVIEVGGMELDRNLIKSKVVKSLAGLFNEQRLFLLKPKEPVIFNQDNIFTKYIYFLNGYLEVTAAGIQFKKYDTLAGYIWDSQILKHDYTKPATAPDKDYVQRLFFNVSGKDQNRFKDLQILAGYAVHNFISYKLKCIFFTDSRISEDDEANGRTCKTLLARLIGGVISNNPTDPSIKSYVEINGKNFDPKDKHKHSICDIDTKLVVLNDLVKNFDVDILYNDITEGINVDKKGLQPFKIYAKMIASSNKAVKIEGSSSKDRFVEFELADYYSDVFTPEMEFGHWFFRDWKTEDYCRYYYFMAGCCQQFFIAGCKLPVPKEINLKARKLLQMTSREFIDWIEQDLKPTPATQYEKGQLFDNFIKSYPDYDTQRFTRRKFGEWLKIYINHKEGYTSYRKEANEARSSDKRYFIFLKDENTN